MRRHSFKLVMPLILVEVYWIITYIIYRYGIIKYPFANDSRVLIFLTMCNLFFAMGYLIICHHKRKNCIQNVEMGIENGKKLLLISTIVAVILYIPNSMRYTGNWYPDVFNNLVNPGETYQKVIASVSENGMLRIFGFFDIFPFMIFPLMFIMWDFLKWKLKLASSVTAFGYLLLYCTGGRNMPILLFVLSVIVTYIVKMCSDRISLRTFIRDTLICVSSIVLVIVMFTMNLKSRTFYSDDVEEQMTITSVNQETNHSVNQETNHSVNQETNQGQNDETGVYLQYKDLIITIEQKEKCDEVAKIFPMYTNPYTKQYADPDNLLYKAIPDSAKFLCVMADAYASGSYHALSVALRLEHQWTYGIGFSEFLQDYLNMFTGIDIKSITYGSRVAHVTEPSMVSVYGWPTAYVQLAGDLTFPGVVVFMGGLGAVVALLWQDILEKKNVYGIPFVSQIALFLLFLPANCITFNSGGYFVTFWGTALIWLISLQKRKCGQEK